MSLSGVIESEAQEISYVFCARSPDFHYSLMDFKTVRKLRR